MVTEKDLYWLEQLDKLISFSDFYAKKIIRIPKDKKTRKVKKFQALNPISTAIIRIKETTQYIIQLKLKHENVCGQAFDFYELLDCISIIEGCIDGLAQIIAQQQLNNLCKENKIFTKQGLAKNFDDLGFFKFIRSAAAVHPIKTDRFTKKTIFRNEFYPWVIWIESPTNKFLNKNSNNAELALKTWNSKTKSIGSKYYLHLNEFYDFLKYLLSEIEELISYAKRDIEKYNQNLNLKKVKVLSDFKKYSDYLRYLHERIAKRISDEEYTDGGMLILSHLFDNPLISDEFKDVLKKSVEKVVDLAKTNIIQIGAKDVFDWIDINKVFDEAGSSNQSYVASKFSDYLYQEAFHEIQHKHFTKIPKLRSLKNNSSNSFYVWHLLKTDLKNLYKNDELERCKSYIDLYELTLEACYFWQKQKVQK